MGVVVLGIGIVLIVLTVLFFSEMGAASENERLDIDPKWIDDPLQYAAWRNSAQTATEFEPVSYTVTL